MTAKFIALILLSLTNAASSHGQGHSTTAITQQAFATLKIQGFADFLVADGKAVWTTNLGRVEKLQHDQPQPVAVVSVPKPCGAMALDFDAVWVANCGEGSIYRIDRQSASVAAVIPTGLADPTGELSVAAGAGSVWVLTDSKGVLSRIDPETNKVIAQIAVAPYSYAAVFGFDAVWITTPVL